MLYEDCTCSVALLARRTCFEHVGLYDESLVASEDWDMWLRVARHHRFVFVDKTLARIRLHDSNLTGAHSDRLAVVLEGRTIPLDKFFGQAELPASLRLMSTTAYSNVHLSTGLRWLQAGDIRKAAASFFRAVRVGNRRPLVVVRIAWFAVAVPLLRRCAIGRYLEIAFADYRRRRRSRGNASPESVMSDASSKHPDG
jgi:hypothetical protein